MIATKEPNMLAYHSDPAVKTKYLARVRAHREADELRAGVGFEIDDGRVQGCAVGCTFDAYEHSRGPIEIGVPEVVMHLEDAIFEGLGRECSPEHLAFPEAFLSAIRPGADLSMVWPRWAVWMLAGLPDGGRSAVRAAIDGMKVLYERWVGGYKPTDAEFVGAVWAARVAGAAWAARAAEAARAARAAGAAGAAGAARAAWAAEAVWAVWAARADYWRSARDELLRLLAEAPVKQGRCRVIAAIETPVSSVTALAERCCREAGTTLAAIQALPAKRWPRPLRIAFDDAVYRMKHSDHPPSFQEIGAAFGYRSHDPVCDAYQRAAKRRMMVQYHESYTVGMGVVAGLPDDAPPGRPMYDDGEDDRDGRGMAEGSVATRFKAGKRSSGKSLSVVPTALDRQE